MTKSIEHGTLSDFTPDPQNRRRHTPENLQMIAAALREVGTGRSIVVDEDDVILAGSGVHAAALDAGVLHVRVIETDGTELIAVRRRGLTPEQKRALAIYDNRAAELAEWNVEQLALDHDAGLDLQPFWSADEERALLASHAADASGLGTITLPNLVALAELQTHPRAFRSFGENELAHVKQTIRDHGLYQSVVVARDNTVLAGQDVVEAARQLGLSHVPVTRLDVGPTDVAAMKVLIGDSERAQLADVDDRKLTDLLKEIIDVEPAALLGTGYEPRTLAALAFTTRASTEIESVDEAAHWVGMPEYDTLTRAASRLTVNFANDADRLDFFRRLGITNASDRTKYIWWPLKDREAPTQRFEG